MIKTRIVQNITSALAHWSYSLRLGNRTTLSIEDSINVLRNFSFKEKPIFRQNNTIAPAFDLQVIVPVYNTENYLDDCINSLLNQKTEFTFQVIAVDDGSTDESRKILDKYADHPLLTVIHQENGGVSKARNRALERIAGKYVMFVDSDDKLPDGSIQKLLEVAYKYNAEIVEGGHQLFSSTISEVIYRHSDSTTICASRNLFGYPWGKVIRSDKLRTFCFPNGFVFEDTVMRTLLYPTCSVVYTIPDSIYIYIGITVQE